MKRLFSRHQTAFWGLCLLCALALGAVTGNRFTDDPDEGYSHGAKSGLTFSPSGGTVGDRGQLGAIVADCVSVAPFLRKARQQARLEVLGGER